jgi:hypothetical protein
MSELGVLRWEDPPAEHGNAKPKKPSKYQPIADALRSRPGQWALIAAGRTTGSAGSFSHGMRHGVNPWAPAGSFEAKIVGPASGLAKVYARYVGEPDGEVA